jgi:hypothetical protein
MRPPRASGVVPLESNVSTLLLQILHHTLTGLGNISQERRSSATAADLQTPTIKTSTYTTGRGGTGNMAYKDPAHPELARQAQDVDAPPMREPEGPFHFGRGGAANIATPSQEEQEKAKARNRGIEREAKRRDDSFASNGEEGQREKKGIMDMLGLGGEKK